MMGGLPSPAHSDWRLKQFNIFYPDTPGSFEHQLDLDLFALLHAAEIERGLVPAPTLRADCCVLQCLRKECALARDRAIHFEISFGDDVLVSDLCSEQEDTIAKPDLLELKESDFGLPRDRCAKRVSFCRDGLCSVGIVD